MERSKPMLRGKHQQRAGKTPVWLCLVVIGAMAWLYLFQADRVSAANATLQAQNATSQQLQRRQQEALQELGHMQSAATIVSRALALGMQQGNWGDQP